jgi:RNA polymerase-binding transcription factor DksA
MPDTMDAIQEHALREQEDLQAQACGRIVTPGKPECAWCDEPISALRQSMGADLCLECQRDRENLAARGLHR